MCPNIEKRLLKWIWARALNIDPLCWGLCVWFWLHSSEFERKCAQFCGCSDAPTALGTKQGNARFSQFFGWRDGLCLMFVGYAVRLRLQKIMTALDDNDFDYTSGDEKWSLLDDSGKLNPSPV